MSVLFIDDDVLKTIFTGWIYLNDVRQTDTAFCSHQLRSIFLYLLREQIFTVVNESGLKTLSPAMAWISLRAFYCDKLALQKFLPSQKKVVSILIRNAKKISIHDEFCIDRDSEVLVTNRLKSLSLIGSKLPTELCSIFINRNVANNKIENLSLVFVSVSPPFLSLVAQHCFKLQSISFQYCNELTDEAFELILELCTNISDINLFSCQKLSQNTIHLIEHHAHNLTSINYSFPNSIGVNLSPLLSKCLKLHKIRPTGIISGTLCGDLLPNQILHLKEINVGCCSCLERADFGQLLCHCPYLEILRICGTQLFCEDVAKSLIKHCHNSYRLESAWNNFHCTESTVNIVVLLFQSCSGITQLEIGSEYGWNDTILCAIAPHLSNVLTLRFHEDGNITNAALFEIAKYCKNLTYLNVQRCPLITLVGIEEILDI